MKVPASLLLLSSSAISSVYALPEPRDLVVRQNSDPQVLAHYATSGNCFWYYTNKINRDKMLQPCKEYCKKQPGNDGSAGCQGPPVDISKIDNGLKYRDSDGNPWVPGDCKCSFPIAKAIADIVFEALKDIDKVLCAVMLNAAQLTIEIGVDLIPGGAELGAAEKLVEGAKTWAENGLKVANFFPDWIGKVCGIPDWHTVNIEDLFGDLLNTQDSHGKSKGCLAKDKSTCKPLPKPNPKKLKSAGKGAAGKKGTPKKPTTPAKPAKPAQGSKPVVKSTKPSTAKKQPKRRMAVKPDMES